MFRTVKILGGGMLLTCLTLAALSAADPLYLELTAHGQRLDLGLSEFSTSRAKIEEAAMARRMHAVVKADLLFPRLFHVVEGGAPPVRQKVDLSSWKALGADILVTGYVDTGWFGRFAFVGALYDVPSGELILKKKFVAELEKERQVAHQWADEIVRHFLGEPGIAQSKIVFVNDQSGHKEVYEIDYDGHNLRRLTRDRSISLLPKSSPDGQWLVYTSFAKGSPHLVLLNRLTLEKHDLASYPGLNTSAVWLPDGGSLIATLSLGEEPNLHEIDRQGRVLRTLTHTRWVDTAPTLSPDGRFVAFTSDRPGYPQIYTMDIHGANVKRLSYAGQCDSPAWSPQGDLVAFAMSDLGDAYDIHTIELAGGGLRRLTWGQGSHENPAWSPNGRYLVFTSTRRGRKELWIMGADGANPRPLGDIPGNSSTAFWGY